MKKILIRLAGIFALTSALLVPQLGAVDISLTTSSEEFVGLITPGVPSSGTQEEGYINYLRQMTVIGPVTPVPGGQTYTRSNLDLNPLPAPDFTYKSDNDQTDFYLVDFTGYVLGKYDANNAGSWVWYLEDYTGNLDVPATFGGKYGLSHTSFFGGTPVPDGGTTAILLGLCLMGLSLINRRRSIA